MLMESVGQEFGREGKLIPALSCPVLLLERPRWLGRGIIWLSFIGLVPGLRRLKDCLSWEHMTCASLSMASGFEDEHVGTRLLGGPARTSLAFYDFAL